MFTKSWRSQMLKRAKPYVAVILLQFGFAGMATISKFALNKGMSQHVLVVYRHVVATAVIAPFAIFLDRKVRPKMTLPIFAKIMLLGLLEPVIDQNLYYTGMKLTTATFTSSMINVLPAFAFVMAWILRLEKVKVSSLHSLAKVLGTIVTIGGAMFMTMVKGPILNLPWGDYHKGNNHQQESTTALNKQDPLKGGLMVTAGCVSWSAFIILQAITLKSYPTELSLTALICLAGTVEGTAVALAMEWNNPAAWSIHLDSTLLAALYSGIVCSGIAFYIQGLVMKERGPVFVTAFNPLGMVIVAIIGSLVLNEITCLGRVVGAIIIVIGLYMFLWGKTKDCVPSESLINSELTPMADEEMNIKKTLNQEPGATDFVDSTGVIRGEDHDESV
ncbi:hypothetical protein FNV43_RR24853 [Rhamnella rubrinervis]|uniref:WAT1-related protein n=1 Tax=Rhamnella rubrinervis TaxID=2594499 RepID=A0A8K0GTK5_9ROSA|nr:hypothetical protein FNV43_RR24853 [Rhamnella rubrinervis]